MKKVYQQEMPHFLKAITCKVDDIRFSLPQKMVEDIYNIVKNKGLM